MNITTTKQSILNSAGITIYEVVFFDNDTKTISQIHTTSEKIADLLENAPALYQMVERLNTAGYTRTSQKEWRDLLAETKPLLKAARLGFVEKR